MLNYAVLYMMARLLNSDHADLRSLTVDLSELTWDGGPACDSVDGSAQRDGLLQVWPERPLQGEMQRYEH